MKDYRKALQDMVKLTELGNQEPIIWFRINKLLLKIGDYEEGVRLFTLAIKQDPNMSKFWQIRGKFYLRCVKFQQGLDDFKEARKLDPKI